MHPRIVDAFEEIDADVFNGDSIKNNIELARSYITRWVTELPELNPATSQRPGPTSCEAHVANALDCLLCRILRAQAELRRPLTRGELAALQRDVQVASSPATPAITFETREERDAAAVLLQQAKSFAKAGR